MITAKQVNKNFGKFKALKDITFEIQKGEIVGFLGQNGAGKTTLMRILTTYLPFTSGKVFISDKDIVSNSIAVRRKIGYLPEVPPLYPDMSVKNYLKFAAQLKDIPAKEQNMRVDGVMDKCDIAGVENKIISTLSKGFKQRVGIAQAIINDPEVLILDEPTSGLDPSQLIQVRELIKSLEHERTVILSTHILSEVEQLAKRVLIIKSGEIITDKPLDVLMNQLKDKRKVFLRTIGDAVAIEGIIKKIVNLRQVDINTVNGVHNIELEASSNLNNFNELLNGLIAVDVQIVEIREEQPKLEDIFMELNR